MKKTIVAVIALSLLFGSLAIAKENERERERISDPTEIRNFSDIVKKGKDLFGVRIKELEKIAKPEDIKNFEGIKKIGTTLWGLRKKVMEPAEVRPEAVACVKAAIDKKDTALKNGIAPVGTAYANLVDQRNSCQKAALDKTTAKEQREANRACLETYKKAIENGKKAVKDAQKQIWQTYRTDLKACDVLQKSNDDSAEINIEDGGLGLEF